MTWFDFFIVSVLGLSVLFAWMRGFTREVGTLLAIGAGVLALHLFGAQVGGLFGDGLIGPIVSRAVLFLVGFILGSIVVEIGISAVLGRDPGQRDRLAGIVFGLVRGWLLLGLIFILGTYYFDENDMPPPMENARLKGVATSAASVLERFGLEKEAIGDLPAREDETAPALPTPGANAAGE